MNLRDRGLPGVRLMSHRAPLANSQLCLVTSLMAGLSPPLCEDWNRPCDSHGILGRPLLP